jgi:hypothetical protein
MDGVIASLSGLTLDGDEQVADFYLVAQNGSVAGIPPQTLIAIGQGQDMPTMYAFVESFIHEFNQTHQVEDEQVVGLVHTFRAALDGDDDAESIEDGILVAAFDNQADSLLVVMPITDGQPGEPVYGSGGSAFLDPWGAFRTSEEISA